MSKYIKMISDFNNPYFSNNKLMTGTEIPTDGTYAKGDIIVNIGEDSVEAPMWICVEAGTPGVWEVVGIGSGSGSSSSSSRLGCIKSRVVVDQVVTEVAIGIGGFNKATDVLLVFANGELMAEGVDFEINGDSTKIVGKWNEVMASDFTFDFVVMKSMNIDGSVSSGSELVCLRNNVIVNKVVSEVEIGIEGFNNETDLLTVYRNTVYMIEGIDYRVEGNKIVSLKGNWNADGGADYKFTFEVMKLVAKVNPEAIVGMDNLNEDVREAIEAAGNIDLSGYQEKSDSSLSTTDKTIVGAINELFQSANNGKELIASAIGEPISSEDTFQAMSNDINGLLSTFKTNMMNNGVSVEATDKFKALIDKIATLADNEGKGIQYAEGTIDDFGLYVTSGDGTISDNSYDLTFTPTLLFVKFDSINNSSGSTVTNVVMSNKGNGQYLFGYYALQFSMSNITNSGFSLAFRYGDNTNFTFRGVTWYAIGVGEEDTTLRDSLANILEDKGVDVTEEDDMASLITKVDSIKGGLDIISATELPSTGRENQICVITDNPVDNILVTSSVADVQSEGINIYLGNSSSDDVSMGTVMPVSSNGITMNYYFNRIYQGSNRLESYYYSNNTWNQLTKKYIPIFEDGAATSTALNPSLNYIGASVTDGELVIDASAQGDFYLVYTKNKINFSDISKIEVVLKKNWVNGNYNVRLYVASTDNPSTYNNNVVNQSQKDVSSTSYTTWTINTSSWTGSHYLMIQKYNEYSGLRCYIESIRLY